MSQPLGSFGTLGPKLSYGTSWIAEIIHWIISPNVRTHLRKVSLLMFIFNLKAPGNRSFFVFVSKGEEIIHRSLIIFVAISKSSTPI